MNPFQWSLSLNAPTANRKDGRFTFHMQRTVQLTIADFVLCTYDRFASSYSLLLQLCYVYLWCFRECFFPAASIRDAVGSNVKIEFMRAVQVEVKADRYESRILVSFLVMVVTQITIVDRVLQLLITASY